MKVFVLLCVALMASACGGGGHTGQKLPPASMTVRSTVLHANQPIGPPYVCVDDDHLGTSPPISWSRGPAGTKAYAVTMIDRDAHSFLHWGLLGLPSAVTTLSAGTHLGHEVQNDFHKKGYGGPCPPGGSTHHYVITVWALKHAADDVDQLPDAALTRGTLTVTYRR